MSNKKVFLLGKDNKNWSIDKDRENAKHFLKTLKSVQIVENKYQIIFSDIIYCVWYSFLDNPEVFYLIKFLKKIKGVRVIAVVTNQISLYKDRFEKLNEIVDVWVYPNEKIGSFLKEHGVNSKYLPFYIDKNIFKNLKLNRKNLCEYFNLDYERLNNKFLIGSFQRDSAGSNLLKPKWQKDPDFLIKIMNKLPKNKVELILAGPRRHYIINEAEKLGIPYTFVGNINYIYNNKDDFKTENNLSIKDVSLLYNLIDLYLITSKSESGPKAVLESSMCETLVMSTDVGMSKEVLNSDLIYNKENLNNLLDLIRRVLYEGVDIDKYTNYNKRSVNNLLDEDKIKKCYKDILDFNSI